MEMVAPVGPMYQAGTLSGNPLAMAAGIANLTYMEEHNVCAALESHTAILVGGLQRAAEKAGVPVQCHRLGSMFTVFFNDKPVTDYASAATSDLDAFRIYFHSMLEQGIYLPPSQFETNFISLAHTPEDIEKTIAAAEKAGLQLFLGSYPITPATDILHELSKRKDLGVITVQAEDEIAGICTAIGGSFAGCLAATSTSGPGLALKSEAIGLAVIAELPLVIIDVQRGGPSTGMPTKSEQTDLMQALYGRNGESPLVVIAASTPTDCFDAAYWAGKLAVEHMTPVILMTDAFIANGSSAWRLPDLDNYPEIKPNYVSNYQGEKPWKAYRRDKDTQVRYWAIPGMEGFAHRLGGLEKDYDTSAISTDPINHQKMVTTRQAKIDKIADFIPELEVLGDPDADLLLVGWGGTYGHLYEAMETMHEQGKKVALAHFKFISPLPKNTAEVLSKYKKVVVAEQNNGQFANYLRGKVPGFNPYRFNRVKGQPFVVARLVEEFTKILEA